MTSSTAHNGACCGESGGHSLAKVMDQNKQWRESVASKSDVFSKLAATQSPEYLWIGCADSRVPPNPVLGLGLGEVFVQRNVGNIASHKDANCMACLEYTVDHLKVKHVMVVGHYNCGAVKAALVWAPKTAGYVSQWIADVRDTRNTHAAELKELGDFDKQWDRLVELNVVRQVANVCTSSVVQGAWDRGQAVAVHGLVYSPADGSLKELTGPITSPEGVPSAHPSSKHAGLVTEQLRTTMSFTQ